MTSLARCLAAEASGSALLVATVVGSGIMAERLTQDAAVALFCNTFPTAAMLVVLITVLGPISGAHFNPVVSLVAALKHDLSPRDALSYAAVQAIGAALGSMLAHGMFALPLIEISTHARGGAGPWLGEFVATFGLVAVVLAADRLRLANVATLVGLYIGAAYWFTSSTSFANPAVTIGRALTDTFAGIAPADVPAFLIAQVAGGLAAMAAGQWLWPAPVPAAD